MILKKLIMFVGLVAAATLAATAVEADPSASAWKSLLDPQLSQWEIWIAVPDPSVSVPGYTHAADPKQDEPLGLNHDPLHIYTVRMVDGEPVLHITGEIFGGLTTLTNYGNFHLRVQQRWGTAKFAPKLGKPRDNGILYRCYGSHGTVNHAWKRCIECQVQENDIGDFFSLGVQAEVPSTNCLVPSGARPITRYVPGAPLQLNPGRCCRGADYHELPNGEWNTIEVMAVGDRSIHILNGRVVNILQNARRAVGEPKIPAVTGQIQIQSEGAECEYRRMEIQPLAAFPAEYQALFSEPNSAVERK